MAHTHRDTVMRRLASLAEIAILGEERNPIVLPDISVDFVSALVMQFYAGFLNRQIMRSRTGHLACMATGTVVIVD